jgi:hypothetical protein
VEIIETTNQKSGRVSFECENRHIWECMDVASNGESFFRQWWQCADLIDGYYRNHNRVETLEDGMKYLLKKDRCELCLEVNTEGKNVTCKITGSVVGDINNRNHDCPLKGGK